MPLFEPRAFRVLLTILAFIVVLAFLWLARYTLIAFLFAILFAYLLEPLVPWLEKVLRIPRGWAIVAIYAILVGLMGWFFLAVGPQLARQGENLAREVPSLSQEVSSGNLVHRVGVAHGWSVATQRELGNLFAGHQSDIVAIEHQLASYAASFVANLWWIILIPILSVFFLASGRTIGQGIIEMAALRRQRELLDNLLADLHDVLAHFIRAQLILMLIAVGVYLGFLTLFRVPYAVALGVSAGVLEFIPTVGPFIGAVLILVVSFLMGYPHWVILPIFLIAWRIEQDYVNSPKIMGSHLQLRPLLIIFGVLVGAEIGGVIGVFLSIPIIASLRVFWLRWRAYENTRFFTPPPNLFTSEQQEKRRA